MFQVKRVTTPQELQLAFQVRKEVFVEEQHVPIDIEIDNYEESSNHFIVLYNGEAVATVRLRKIDTYIGKVERLCVLQYVRGKKIGQLLMEAIEQFARSNELTQLILNAQSSAIPFYEKYDYQIISEVFYEANIPHRTMTKQL